MTTYRHLSWDEIQTLSQRLIERLRPLGPWAGLVAVTRGGLVAQGLGIKIIDTFCIASYAGTAQGGLSVLKAPALSGRVLVIDELSDTGATARLIRAALPEACLATLFAKPAGRDAVDVFIEESPQDVWLCFPWESLAIECYQRDGSVKA
jgi:xanthine phosphoribosyltransferase